MTIKLVGYDVLEEQRLQSRIASMLSNVPTDKLEYAIASNVIAFPKGYFNRKPKLGITHIAGLYTSRGDLIPSSCLFRGHNNETLLPYHVPDIGRLVKEYARGTYLYGGFLADHYGHILTESVSRLWYYQNGVSVDGIVFCGAQQLGQAAHSVFTELGVLDHRIIMPQDVMRFERVIIPQPSMINRRYVHQQHIELFRDRKSDLLDLRYTQRPLYLSRRLLKQDPRHVLNEGELEDFLMSKGAQVEHPQFLSLREQIRLINEHDIIIGLRGSALHTILFAKKPKKLLHLSSSVINWNYPLLDNACKNQAVYLNCVKGTKGEASLDIEMVRHEFELMIEDIQ